MALMVGTKLGSYQITGLLGKGGMGEVYRARDAKLDRDVAIKVLPQAFARDAARMARFGREARLLAALDHANIAAVYGLEDSGDTRALVMQLAEGPTLADRIAQEPIPIEETLPIIRQIAEALEYAHERGIIHRDLKPANVKVSTDGVVKLLDFGLAKAMESEPSTEDISDSPTQSMTTQVGVLLGTAAYMSPEQAKGKTVDRRADIWAFGCVLYEMLTGAMAFHGDTVTDTLAAVMKEEPDWSRLPAATPTQVRALLQRCFQKDARQRLRDIGEARISLDEVPSLAPERAPSLATVGQAQRRLWLVSGIASLLLLATVLLALLYLRQRPAVPQVMRFEIPLPENVALGGAFALSPDGSKLAFIGRGSDGQNRLWVRSLETLVARPLDGSEGASGNPFWSSDSHFIAFLAQGKLKKIEAAGGAALTLCDANQVWGGAWSRDNRIVFASNAGVLQVGASGDSCSPIDTQGGASGPAFLPDGRHFVYFRWGGSDIGIYLASVDAKPQERPSKLLAELSNPVYAPAPDPAVGYLLFTRGSTAAYRSTGTLMAQRFDTRRLKPVGEAVPIAEHVWISSASGANLLVYVQGSQNLSGVPGREDYEGQLTWFGRDGNVLETVGDPGLFRSLALSPDEKYVVFDREDPQDPGTRNLWLYEFARGVSAPLTFGRVWDHNPVWAPDGSRIAYGSFRNGIDPTFQKASNLSGDENELFKSREGLNPSDWSADGRFLLCSNNLGHLSLLPLNSGSADRKLIPLESSEFHQFEGRFSPDHRWITYSSDDSGRYQIYVRPFEDPSATRASDAKGTPVTGKWPVSKDGGTAPLWRRDGKELFYLGSDGWAMAVEVSTIGLFQAGVPKRLFKVPAGVFAWDVSSDGKQFLMSVPSAARATQPKFTVVLNWEAALNRK